jgi:outer membrane protein TolC
LLLAKKRSLDYLVKKLSLHLDKINKYYDEDLIKKTDLLETQLKLKEIKLHQGDLNQLIENERLHFISLCGIEPEDIEDDYSEDVDDFNAVFAHFQTSHPFLKILDKKGMSLDLQKKIIDGFRSPKIFAFAELHYGRPGINYFSEDWLLYAVGGITLDLPIYRGDKVMIERAICETEHNRIENQKDQFIEEMEEKLKQLYNVMESLDVKISVLDNMIHLAEEDVRLKEKLYQENQIDNVDFLLAMTELEKIQSMKNELQVEIEWAKTRINLLICKTVE